MNKLMYYFDEGPIPLAARSALLRKLFMIHFLNGNFHDSIVKRIHELLRINNIFYFCYFERKHNIVGLLTLFL